MSSLPVRTPLSTLSLGSLVTPLVILLIPPSVSVSPSVSPRASLCPYLRLSVTALRGTWLVFPSVTSVGSRSITHTHTHGHMRLRVQVVMTYLFFFFNTGYKLDKQIDTGMQSHTRLTVSCPWCHALMCRRTHVSAVPVQCHGHFVLRGKCLAVTPR